jgi:hypothetical protein
MSALQLIGNIAGRVQFMLRLIPPLDPLMQCQRDQSIYISQLHVDKAQHHPGGPAIGRQLVISLPLPQLKPLPALSSVQAHPP